VFWPTVLFLVSADDRLLLLEINGSLGIFRQVNPCTVMYGTTDDGKVERDEEIHKSTAILAKKLHLAEHRYTPQELRCNSYAHISQCGG
jgi:hypothetical protein